MLLLVFAGIFFLFLLIGAVVFLACLPFPKTRPYALSAALWCAMWGPCSIALMVIAGAGLVAATFLTKAGDAQRVHAPTLLSTFGWTYLIAGIVITTIVATAAAWIHQAVVKRLTFALFRLYAATVSAGIGSVFGWCVGWWMMVRQLSGNAWLILWGTCMCTLIGGFALASYKRARNLRGDSPGRLTWISPDEFAGR